MKTSFAKISFILMLVIVLPIAVLMIFEIRSLNENEKVLESIYSKQLETFLFSINQYSDDVINSMANRIDEAWTREGKLPTELVSSLPGVSGIIFLPLTLQEEPVYYSKEALPQNEIFGFLQNSIDSDSSLVKKLKGYREAGFRKFEAYKEIEAGENIYNTLLFVLGDTPERYTICVVILQPADFIEELLGPKMEQVAGEEFVLSASRRSSGQLIFTTDSLMENKAQSNPIWLLPAFDLELYVPGNSIETITRERTRSNLALLGIVAAVLTMGFVVVFRSIKKEVQLAQTKSDFVSNVSHEIRTPLALISMFAETLLMNRVPTEERKKEYYEIIAKETARLTNIVNKILNFSQIEANKKSYHFETVSLNSIATDVLHTYSFHLQNKGFEYEVRLTEPLPLVRADKDAVVEAIINLIDNAIKYSKDIKQITIATEKDGRHVAIAVSDKGVGIENKKIRQIFDKFYRVTQGDIYNAQGAGLGLSIVKHIMEAHDGQILVKSDPDKGSTFKLMFPIFEDKQIKA